MDLRKVKKLIALLEASDLTELEIHEGEESVRLSRYPQAQNTLATVVPNAMTVEPVTTEAAAAVVASTQSVIEPAPSKHILKSPMVGTFYRAASPGATPLVEIGQEVRAGESVCIIEAMKMFNQIEADRDGIIIDVLVENGHPVEYDQPLFVID